SNSLTLAHPPFDNTYVVNYTAADLSRLTINLGNHGNTVTVNNTPSSGFASGLVTTVRGGSGVDTMNVLRTTGRLAIDGGGGQDNVTIANAGRLTDILAAVTITNPPSYTAVTVDDSADPVARTVTLDTVSFSDGPYGRVSFGGVPIQYKYADTSSVTLHTGTGGATVNVLATRVDTNLVGHADNTTVNVGNAG